MLIAIKRSLKTICTRNYFHPALEFPIQAKQLLINPKISLIFLRQDRFSQGAVCSGAVSFRSNLFTFYPIPYPWQGNTIQLQEERF
ncbi:hypothetical protein Npun_AR141 (plasmid) [Nostoc punctiforme PCC 73102]|uniref:Uncharacterized protein n=1 Tax=Nostoc punctiforme (strain ATCC 29133 / PCC 73102) TaxID=63737 RepID=B2JAQ3_NOSP7|nr:hypothetical protein Npun_AR141 [Nostoc punctiforme PCC 73102]